MTRTPTLTPTPVASATPTPTASPTFDLASLAGVAEDGEVTIEEAQAIIDAHLAIYNPTVVALLETPDADLPPLSPPEMVEAALAIYGDVPASFQLEGWDQALTAGLPGFRRTSPTGYSEQVVAVDGVNDNCIRLQVAQDFSGVVENPESSPVSFFELLKDEQSPPRNKTTWIRNYEALEPPPENISCL